MAITLKTAQIILTKNATFASSLATFFATLTITTFYGVMMSPANQDDQVLVCLVYA